MNTYPITVSYDNRDQINTLHSFTVESNEPLYNADQLVKQFCKVAPTNTVIVSEFTRCVVGDDWVVIVEAL